MAGRRDLKSVPYHLRETDPDLYNFLVDLQNSEADGVPGGVTTTEPSEINAGDSADIGTEELGWSPGDHQHAVATATASGLANSNAEGTSTSLSRADHSHKRDVRVAKGGSDVGTRNRLNFADTATVTVTVADDSGSDEIDISFTAAAVAHALLSATHTDTVPAAVLRGALIVGNSTPAWQRLALGASATFLRSDGTDAAWTAIAYSDLPAAAQHWTRTGAIVHLTTAGDEVSIGDATLIDAATNKVEVNRSLAVKGFGDTSSAIPILASYRTRDTFASPDAVQSGDELLNILAYGHDGAAFASAEAAAIKVRARANFNGTDYNSCLEFWTGRTGAIPEITALVTDLGTFRAGLSAAGSYESTALAAIEGMPSAADGIAGLASLRGADSNDALMGVRLIRARFGTDPGAGFGTYIGWSLEGADLTLVEACRMSGFWEGAQSDNTTARDSALTLSTMLNNSISERFRVTSAGVIQAGADAAQDLGTSSVRWASAHLSTRVNIGVTSSGGSGLLHLIGQASSVVETVVDSFAAQSNHTFRRAAGSPGSPSALSLGSTFGQIQWHGYDGGAYREVARIAPFIANSPSSNNISGDLYFYVRNGASALGFVAGFDARGSFVLGPQSGNLSSSATDGFFYIRGMTVGGGGSPSGTPSAFTGAFPMVYDSTNDTLWIHDGTNWNPH